MASTVVAQPEPPTVAEVATPIEEGARARLDDGRALVVKTPAAESTGLPSAGLLEGLEARGGLTRLSWGWLAAVELSIAPEVDHG